MKKTIIGSIAIVAIAAVVAFNLQLNTMTGNKLANVSLMNIEALAAGDKPPTGAGIKEKEECQNNGGYWNMALVCDGGGVTSVVCNVAGELSVLGFTLKGSYSLGKTYDICWERWACKESSGNCCIASSQGVRICG